MSLNIPSSLQVKLEPHSVRGSDGDCMNVLSVVAYLV